MVVVLLFAIPEYQPEQLLPILPKGLTPVMAGAYYTFGFPYSEVFLFGMLLPFAAGKKLKKADDDLVYLLRGKPNRTLCCDGVYINGIRYKRRGWTLYAVLHSPAH